MKVDYSYWQIFYDPDIPIVERVGLAALSPIAIPLMAFTGCTTRSFTGNVHIENSDAGADAGKITPADTVITTDSAHDTYTSELPPDTTLADLIHPTDTNEPDATNDMSEQEVAPPDVTPDAVIFPEKCPSQVSLSSSCNIVSIAAGHTSTFVAMKDGSVSGWGKITHINISKEENLFSSLAPTKVTGLKNITQVSIHFQHLLALDNAGKVWAIGQNGYGQLGNGMSFKTSNGVNVDSATPIVVPDLANIVSLATGKFHSLALDSSGKLYAWGNHNKGQLGLGDPKNPATPLGPSEKTTPTLVVFPQTNQVSSISAGALSSFAVQESGAGQSYAGYMWGHSSGDPIYAPQFIDKAITKITGGNDFACYQTTDCGVSCNGKEGPTAAATKTLTTISDIIAGGRNFVAITQSGDAYIWGDNASGQTGLGSANATIETPTLITGLGKIVMASVGTGFCYDSKIYAGKDCTHICVVTAGCEVYCAGGNQVGQLGNGSTSETPSSTWVKVNGLP